MLRSFMKSALLTALFLSAAHLAVAAPPVVEIGYLPPGFSISKTLVEPANPMVSEADGIPDDVTSSRQVIFKVKNQPVRENDFGMSNYVFVSELGSANAKQFPSITAAAKTLKSLLAKRPAIPKSELPVYPTSDAALAMLTHLTYLDGDWGSGYGAVVAFAQDTPRATNADLVYYFQGLSKDGRYYLTASFALRNPKLPADSDAAYKDDPNGTSEADTQLLEAQPGESFTPKLDELRKLLASITTAEQ